jgi:hypothetical protein
MSRRKALVRREASGKVKRQPVSLPSPLEVVRLRDAALVGMRDRVWGTTLGRLFLTGKITAGQFAAGKHWARLAADYAEAVQAPRGMRTAALDPEGGTPPDPDSPKGQKQAAKAADAIADYDEAFVVLERYRWPIAAVVVAVCERGQVPVGWAELLDLRRGLSALIEAQLGQRR